MSTSATPSSTYAFSAGPPLIDRPSRVGRARRAFARYLIAICIGVAATLAWQSYGDAIKLMIATRAPELGWSPKVQQMIAARVQQLGWTKPAGSERTALSTTAPEPSQPASVAQTTPEMVAPKTSTGPSNTLEQMQQIAADLAALKQTVEQLATSQDQMVRDIAKAQATDQEVLNKVSAPPPQIATIPTRKRTPISPTPSGPPMPLR